MVALAPAIPGWTIQALESPRPIDAFWEEQLGHTHIDAHDLWCTVPDEGHRPGIAVYHMMYSEADSGLYTRAAEVAIYNVLGERSFGLDTGPISVGNLSTVPEDAKLVKLKELPDYMPGSYSSFVVDASGRMWMR
jgi:hypothetical protein